MNSASHQKSAARKTRAELALMLHNSLSPAAEQLDSCTSVEVQRAVRTLSQLLLPDLFDKMTRKFSLYSVGTASANADPLSTVAQRIDDRNVDLMLEMRPSLYDAMHQIILEEIDQTVQAVDEGLPILYSTSLCHHLLSLALRGKPIDNPIHPTIAFLDPKRSFRFIETGVSLSSSTVCMMQHLAMTFCTRLPSFSGLAAPPQACGSNLPELPLFATHPAPFSFSHPTCSERECRTLHFA